MKIRETIYSLLPAFFLMLALVVFIKGWLKERKLKDSIIKFLLGVFVTYPALLLTDLLFIPLLNYCKVSIDDFIMWIHNPKNFAYVIIVLFLIGIFEWIYILIRGLIKIIFKLAKYLKLRLSEKKKV